MLQSGSDIDRDNASAIGTTQSLSVRQVCRSLAGDLLTPHASGTLDTSDGANRCYGESRTKRIDRRFRGHWCGCNDRRTGGHRSAMPGADGPIWPAPPWTAWEAGYLAGSVCAIRWAKGSCALNGKTKTSITPSVFIFVSPSFLTDGNGAGRALVQRPGLARLYFGHSRPATNPRRTTERCSSWTTACSRWSARPSYALLRPPISAVVPRSGMSGRTDS